LAAREPLKLVVLVRVQAPELYSIISIERGWRLRDSRLVAMLRQDGSDRANQLPQNPAICAWGRQGRVGVT